MCISRARVEGGANHVPHHACNAWRRDVAAADCIEEDITSFEEEEEEEEEEKKRRREERGLCNKTFFTALQIQQNARIPMGSSRDDDDEAKRINTKRRV